MAIGKEQVWSPNLGAHKKTAKAKRLYRYGGLGLFSDLGRSKAHRIERVCLWEGERMFHIF
jgi:hypothetical protein